MLGGAALFLTGHAMFKAVVWHVVPWTRVAAIVVLAALAVPAAHVSALVLGMCTAAVLVAVGVSDRSYLLGPQLTEP